MNIINSFWSAPSELTYNTYIGGLGGVMTTKTLLAAELSCSDTDITDFSIDANNNIKCNINTTYTINVNGFQDETTLTHYIDFDGQCTGGNGSAFNGCDALDFVYLPAFATCGVNTFRGANSTTRLINADVVSVPALSPIGTDATNNACMTYLTTKYFYANSATQTNNGGSPDGDLTNANFTVNNLRYVSNTTPPSAVDDLAIDSVTYNSLQISWSAPSTTNTIEGYMVFVNGSPYWFATGVTSMGVYGLEESTSYTVSIITVDQEGNMSGFSNEATDTTSSGAYDFTGASHIYSLRNLNNISTAFIRVQRDSDSAVAYVFFNGTLPHDSISLDSYIGTTSTTPSTTTLGSWAGTDNIYISIWLDQITGGTAQNLTPSRVGGASLSQYPQIMSSGALLTKNSVPAIQFNGAAGLFNAAANTSLDSIDDFTVFILSANDSTTASSTILHTGRSTNNAFTIYNDSSAGNKMAYAYGSTTSAEANYSSTVTTTNQRLITVIKTTTLSAWYNSTVDSETGITWSGTYTNDEFYIGRYQNSGTDYLDGYIQEVIIYASDQSANRTDIEANINGYYSIY